MRWGPPPATSVTTPNVDTADTEDLHGDLEDGPATTVPHEADVAFGGAILLPGTPGPAPEAGAHRICQAFFLEEEDVFSLEEEDVFGFSALRD